MILISDTRRLSLEHLHTLCTSLAEYVGRRYGTAAANKPRAGLKRVTAGMQPVAFLRTESLGTQSQRDGLQLVLLMESTWQGNGGQQCKGKPLKQETPLGQAG